jgi:hypothetical protein
MTADELREILQYDPEMGTWKWLVDIGYVIKPGDPAGCINAQGYVVITYAGKKYQSARLAHLYMVGELPPHEMDHINRVRADDRWINLRPATHCENMNNRRKLARRGEGKSPAYFRAETIEALARVRAA